MDPLNSNLVAPVGMPAKAAAQKIIEKVRPVLEEALAEIMRVEKKAPVGEEPALTDKPVAKLAGESGGVGQALPSVSEKPAAMPPVANTEKAVGQGKKGSFFNRS